MDISVTSKELHILAEAVSVYGDKSQEDVAIEEMAELTKAIIKHRRYNTKETKENVREELADVFIMLFQLYLIHGFNGTIIEKKINRLANRLKEGDQK